MAYTCQVETTHPLSLASISGCVNQAMVVDSFMVKEKNYLIICAQHCDTYDIVANCNIMLTNKVKNKNIMQSIYSGPLDFDVFEFYSILDFNSKVLIRLLPYLTYKFNINK